MASNYSRIHPRQLALPPACGVAGRSRRTIRNMGVCVLVLTCGVALGADVARWFEGGQRPLVVGAMPPGLGRDPETCAPCHAEIVAEWRGSLHAAAWTEPVFQAAYTREPLSFCRNCHAPHNGGAEPRGLAARDGISCVTCHVRNGHILGSTGAGPHMVRAGVTDDPMFCASCHEFGFHDGGVETAELQQSTMSEWRARIADGRTTETCQGCHMKNVAGHKSHAFAVRRDPSVIAGALDVDVRIEGTALVATVTSKGVGHAVPTGDLFRRLELHAESGARKDVLIYARTFGDRTVAGRHERYERDDTRVGEGPATRRLELGLATGDVVRWRLDYLLMPTSEARRNNVADHVNRTRLHDGVLIAP